MIKNKSLFFYIFLTTIFILIGIGTMFLNSNIVLAADDGNYKVNVIRLEGGDYGFPSPYSHYPRGPGGFKRNLIFDSLLERGEDGLINWLAEDYQIRANGLEYLFTIRENIKWHDGRALNVEDVKFSFEYGLEHPLVWSDLSQDDIKKVEIINENQILITAAEVNSSLVYALGNQRIIPKHIWKDIEFPKEYTKEDALIGTGPYILTDYKKEHGIYRFEAFENFWGPKQNIKSIEFIPVSENIMAFENSKIDLTEISPDLLERYQQNEEYKIVRKKALHGYRFIFNMGKKPEFKNKDLRQAINYAIDQQELIEKIERGAAVSGSPGVLPVSHEFYNPDLKQYNNLDKAKQLLSNAEIDNLSFDLKVVNTSVRLGELIKEQLSRIGISVNVISSDRKTHDSQLSNNQFEVALLNTGGWGGEAVYLNQRFISDEANSNSLRVPGYNNSELTQLLKKQKKIFDFEEKKELLYTVQEILAEELPEIPLYLLSGYTVYRPEKYDGWQFMYDHHNLTHSKLSYLESLEKWKN